MAGLGNRHDRDFISDYSPPLDRPTTANGLWLCSHSIGRDHAGYALGKALWLIASPVTANLVGYCAGLLGLLPFLNWNNITTVNWTPSFCWAFDYLVIENSVIAVGLLLAMIRARQMSQVSTLLLLVPTLAAFIAWATLGEHMPLSA